MSGVDDIIGRWVRQAERSGELRKLPGWGKPLDSDDSYAETPSELRMPYKILKNAGYVPPEIELMNELASARKRLVAIKDEVEARTLRQVIAEKQQKLAIMLDRLRARR